MGTHVRAHLPLASGLGARLSQSTPLARQPHAGGRHPLPAMQQCLPDLRGARTPAGARKSTHPLGPSDLRPKMARADAGYGMSAAFRQGLMARKLAWAVGIPRHLKVYPVDVRMIWPVAKRGRPRQRHVPDILSVPAEDMLRGPILAGPAPSCAHDDDRLRFPPTSPAQNSKTEKRNQRATASADPASRAPRHPRTLRPATTAAMPALSKWICNERRLSKSAKAVLKLHGSLIKLLCMNFACNKLLSRI
jgi:hypothetical protein